MRSHGFERCRARPASWVWIIGVLVATCVACAFRTSEDAPAAGTDDSAPTGPGEPAGTAGPPAAHAPPSGALAPPPARPVAPAGARITGAVVLEGDPPWALLDTSSDPACPQGSTYREDVLVLEDSGLSNVVVRVLPVSGRLPDAPTTTVTLSLDGCRYEPRVQVVTPGSHVEIRNLDRTRHHVHAWVGAVTRFDVALPPGAVPQTRELVERAVHRFTCGVHAWEEAFVFVSETPHADVTPQGGSFTIPVPAGDYTLEAWHERLGTRTLDVTAYAEGQRSELPVVIYELP